MTSLLQKGKNILQTEGIDTLFLRSVDYVYRRAVVPFLPRRSIQYNGVDVLVSRLFDGILPWRSRMNRPNYESGLTFGIEEYVQPGSDVVIVGGGWGVTAVKAAKKTGEQGTVTVYEGSAEEVKQVQETAKINECSNIISVKHTIVGTGLNLRGDSEGATILSPANIPQCDVLELDCEGAEVEILEELGVHPEVILVETHGRYGSPTDKVESILSEKSYTIVSRVIADEDLRAQCKKDDIRVLVALNED